MCKSLLSITAIIIAIFILLARLVVQMTKDIMYTKSMQVYLNVNKTSVDM